MGEEIKIESNMGTEDILQKKMMVQNHEVL